LDEIASSTGRPDTFSPWPSGTGELGRGCFSPQRELPDVKEEGAARRLGVNREDDPAAAFVPVITSENHALDWPKRPSGKISPVFGSGMRPPVFDSRLRVQAV
jgi:hypothetical protein